MLVIKNSLCQKLRCFHSVYFQNGLWTGFGNIGYEGFCPHWLAYMQGVVSSTFGTSILYHVDIPRG